MTFNFTTFTGKNNVKIKNKQMKNIMVFLISILLFVSCKQNDESYKKTSFKKGDAVFSIHIKDQNQAFFRLKSYGVYKELYLDDEGYLTDTLKDISESYFMFSDKRHGVGFYVKPDTHIHVDLDTKDFIKTVLYKGDLSKENTYLRDYFLLNRDMSRVNAIQHLAFLDEPAFKKTIDSVKKVRLQLLADYDRKHHLDKHFKYLEENRIKYEWANRLETYEAYRQFALQDSTFHVSKDYYAFRKQLDMENENLIIIPSYHYYLENFYQKLANQQSEKDHSDVFVTFLNVVNKKVKNPVIKERLLYSYALQNMKQSNDMSRFYVQFKTFSTDSLHQKKIQSLYKELNRLNPGQPAPDYEFVDDKGNKVKLSDLRGNYVYIDIWATWCKPCMAEMPYLEKLKEKYKDAKITFVGINVNDFKTDWLNYIKHYNPKGLRLYAGDDQVFKDLYQVNQVPKSILINPEGRISTANAPRPSQTDLIELLFDRIKTAYK